MAAAAILGIRIDHSTNWSRDVSGLTGWSVQSPSAAGSRASGMPAAPTVSATRAAPVSAASRQIRVREAGGRSDRRARAVARSALASAVIAGSWP